MKYTYQISFNGSDYISLDPNTDIEMNGEWETGTMIWREKISELKISKALNDTVYSTLETWFEDNTYFKTRIFVKVLKNSVQDSLHWFGVKWGKLNKDLTTYTVEPELYDLWAQYFQSTKDIGLVNVLKPLNFSMYFYNDETTYPFLSAVTNWATWDDVIKDISTYATSWSSSDIVSSFLWQDNYEDISPVGTFQGMPLDYVTGKGSPFTTGGMSIGSLKYLNDKTFSDLLEWLKLLRIWVFFDTNDKLRFEHIKFFNDRLTDNAVDFSAYIEDYNEVWNYENTSIPVKETLKLSEVEDDSDEDFLSADIIYSNIRNRPDAESADFTSEFYSNLNYFDTGTIDPFTVFGAFFNQVHTLFNISMTSLISDGNGFSTIFAASTPRYCGSNDIRVFSAGRGYSLTVEISAITGVFDVYLEDRSSSALISNKITVNSTGTTSGTLTSTAPADDGFLKIEATSTGGMGGWITLDYDETIMIPTKEAILSGDPKTNGALSTGNIIDSWWQDDRLSRDAELNSVPYNFNSTQYNLRRETLKFHYADVINPLHGFDDGTRVGKIEKWRRSLTTDFYEIDVIYQEDE